MLDLAPNQQAQDADQGPAKWSRSNLTQNHNAAVKKTSRALSNPYSSIRMFVNPVSRTCSSAA
jgi:hypothetical protein